MLKRALLVASCLLAPALTCAAQPVVPGIGVATASASAGNVTSRSHAEGPGPINATVHAIALGAPAAGIPSGLPPGMPPQIQRLSPSAPLNAKEKASAAAAAAWRNHYDKPVRGEDGILRWPFGTSLPSIVCSPLQVCDLALQPGEVVQQINEGDKDRWIIKPAVTGDGNNRVTHLVIKPTDAGLVSSVLVFTDRRTYSVKLISTRMQWTPLSGFTYPEDTRRSWETYRQAMAAPADARTGAGFLPSGTGDDALNFDYSISGKAAWKPLRVYSQHGKTYIQFPETIRYESAPALVGLANDGGVFSSPSEQMLRYRIVGTGDTFMVDGLLDRAALVSGVGSGQTRIDIRKRGRG